MMIMVALAVAGPAKAQLWDELFNQKKTQTKYLLEQIAALKVYIGHVQKTYRIAGDGLKFIGRVTGSEKDLHDGFFTSLREVSGEVKSYPRASDIVAIGQAVLEVRGMQLAQLRREDMLTSGEMAYVEKVLDKIVADCAKVIEELETVMDRGKLEMEDGERIERIDMLYGQMRDNYEVARGFGGAALQLSMMRKAQQTEIRNSRVIQGGK